MSRSYKKELRCKLDNDAYFKNYSNRIIRRRHRDGDYRIPDGSRYRRVVCPWDICDQNCRGETWNEHKIRWENNERNFWCRAEYRCWKEGRELTEKDVYRDWYLLYKRK